MVVIDVSGFFHFGYSFVRAVRLEKQVGKLTYLVSELDELHEVYLVIVFIFLVEMEMVRVWFV